MFFKLYANENTKTFKRSMLWIELGILAVLIAAIFGLLYSVMFLNLGGEAATVQGEQELQQSITWPDSLVTAISFSGGSLLGGLLLIVLVGAATAQEYTWRTMHLWLSRGASRSSLLLAKFMALILPALLMVLTAMVAGGAITALMTLQLEGGLPVDQVDFLQLGLSVVRTAYTLLPYAGLVFMLAVASRSTVVAIGGGLAYSLLFESILLQMFGLLGESATRFTQYVPANLAQSVNQINYGIVVTTESAPPAAQAASLSPGAAAIGIAVWTLLFLGVSLWVFRRQDLAD